MKKLFLAFLIFVLLFQCAHSIEMQAVENAQVTETKRILIKVIDAENSLRSSPSLDEIEARCYALSQYMIDGEKVASLLLADKTAHFPRLKKIMSYVCKEGDDWARVLKDDYLEGICGQDNTFRYFRFLNKEKARVTDVLLANKNLKFEE